MRTSAVFKDSEDYNELANTSSVTSVDNSMYNQLTHGELMENKLEYVKVKIQSLADEAKYIRKCENKQKTRYRDILLRDRLRATGAIAGQKVGKWTVLNVTNSIVELIRDVQIGVDDQDDDVYLTISKKINLNWSPTKEDLSKSMGTFFGLQNHRTGIVRNEARASHLAYAYIKGIPYNVVEASSKLKVITGNNLKKRIDDCYFNSNVLPRVIAIASKYGNNHLVEADDIIKWIKGE